MSSAWPPGQQDRPRSRARHRGSPDGDRGLPDGDRGLPDGDRGLPGQDRGLPDPAGVREQSRGGSGGAGYRAARHRRAVSEDSGPGESGHAERGFGEGSSGERGSGERGFGEREPGEPGFGMRRGSGAPELGERRSGEGGSGDRGSAEREYGKRGYRAAAVEQTLLGAPSYAEPARGGRRPGSAEPRYTARRYSLGPDGEPSFSEPGYMEPHSAAQAHAVPSLRAPARADRAVTPPGYPSPPTGPGQLPDRRDAGQTSELRVPSQPGPVSAPFVAPAGPGADEDDDAPGDGRRSGGRLRYGRRDAALTDLATGAPSRRRHGRGPAPEPEPQTTGGGRARARTRSGRRRGRGYEPKMLLGLGAGALMVVGAIVAAVRLLQSGPSGPAHTLVTPARLGASLRKPQLARQMGVAQLERNILAQSSGAVSHLVSAVYQDGSAVPGGPPPQVMLFIGGRLAGASASASIATFSQHFSHVTHISAGKLGGEAACVPGQASTGGASVCAWFDNDTFGELVSPHMTAAALASELRAIRPSIERLAK